MKKVVDLNEFRKLKEESKKAIEWKKAKKKVLAAAKKLDW